ncbi:MAG TPA: MFS transporter [Streptosporangiaceae bacterium]|nr:MFS transporter [Streptosporangiaceae bacterium]
MSLTTSASSPGRRPGLVLASLFLGTFVLGSAELVVVGVLNRIAADLSVSVSTAGTLVTAYALGICVGGPALTAVSIRFGRRGLLLVTLAAYILGNVGLVAAASFGEMLAARAITGSLQGLFIGVAFAIGTSVVPPERMGWAISTVFGGIAVSTAVGVPLGTLIGQEFGWRAAFGSIAALGVIALVALAAMIPPVRNRGVGGMRAQAPHALAPRVLAVLATGFLIMGGEFAALTYLTPFLQQKTGITGSLISVFLLAYGAANAAGTFIGGRAADRNASVTLAVSTVILVAALGLLYLAGSVPALVIVALLVFGLAGFGLVPSLQYRTVSLAGPGGDLASTLPASAVTGGIAVGSLIGGWALAHHGPAAPVLTGAIICAIAIPAAIATMWLRPPAPPAADMTARPAADTATGPAESTAR